MGPAALVRGLTAPAGRARASEVGKWLLAAVVPASAMSMGSIPAWALVVMSAAAALACALLWATPPTRMTRATRWVLVAMGVLLAATIAQAVPLPAGLAAAIAPSSADVWARSLSPLREAGPSFHPLSVAPSATHLEVLRGVFYGSVFLASVRVAAVDGGATFLVRLVVASSVAMAFVALAHAATSAERVFGVYRPRELYAYNPGHYSPLLNLNHLAAYLAVGGCVALGALVMKRSMPRVLSAAAAAILVGTSVWQGSRGATGALLFGIVLVIALGAYARRRFEGGRAEVVVIGLCVAAAAVMVGLSTSELARTRLASRETVKVDVARASMELVRESPWFGFGRGAFETVFPSVRKGTTYFTFTHPESLPVQWVVEWGVVVSFVAAAMFCWALRPQTVLRAVRPAVGAWTAIVVVVLHDLVDFHLEVPGVVALVLVCVAIAAGARSRESTEGAPLDRGVRAARGCAFALALATPLAIAWVVPDADHALADDRKRLGRMATDPGTTEASFMSELRGAMRRYPAEAFFPLMGAVWEQTRPSSDGSVVPWIGRALERDPRFGRAHLVLARSIGARSPAQARLEYRLAYEYDENLRALAVREGSRLVDGVDAARDLVPPGALGVEVLEVLVPALTERLPATAASLDADLLVRAPGSASALRRRIEGALADVKANEPWCEGEARRASCLDEASGAAEALVRGAPKQCEALALEVRVRLARGEGRDALDALDEASETAADRATCQRRLIELALESGDRRRADVVLERLMRGGCGRAAECAELYEWAARAEEARENFARAVRLYRRVVEITPERDELLEHVVELATRVGLTSDAIAALDALARRHPDVPKWREQLAEVRSRAMERHLAPSPSGSLGPP